MRAKVLEMSDYANMVQAMVQELDDQNSKKKQAQRVSLILVALTCASRNHLTAFPAKGKKGQGEVIRSTYASVTLSFVCYLSSCSYLSLLSIAFQGCTNALS
jgi:hypothetical protein